MGIYKRGNIYYVDYYFQGERIQKAVGSDRKIAAAVLEKRKLEIVEGKHLDIKRVQKVKFSEFADEYLELHCKPHNKSWHKSDYFNLKNLKEYFAGKCLHEITAKDIEQYCAERIKTVSKSTVNRALNCLSSLYNRAIEWGKATENPMLKVKLFKVPEKRTRYLEREEIARVNANFS